VGKSYVRGFGTKALFMREIVVAKYPVIVVFAPPLIGKVLVYWHKQS